MIVDGRNGAAALRSHYEDVRRLLPLPDRLAPELLVPLDDREITRYVLREWSLPTGFRRRVRNAVAEGVLRFTTLPDVRASVTVAQRDQGAPFLVRAAHELGVPGDADWYLSLGHGDVLTRAVFHLFERGADRPSWILKFSRVPGYSDPFDRDERALRLVAESGAAVEAHAPRLLGRLETHGFHAALETAAVGRKLTLFLQRRGNSEAKRRLINDIASWLVEIGNSTRAAPSALDAERTRVRDEVLPLWSDHDVADIVDALPPLPAVLQHNDPGCWNIVVDEGRFTAVDWESARRHGFPLWDLVYFLTDALVHLDGADAPPARRDRHMQELWKGEAPSSPILYEWVRRGADSLGIRHDDVGPIVLLGWLHHGTSHIRRADSGSSHGLVLDVGSTEPISLRAARIWLTDPGLGRDWRAWVSRAAGG